MLVCLLYVVALQTVFFYSESCVMALFCIWIIGVINVFRWHNKNVIP